MQTRWAWVAAITAVLVASCGGTLPAVEHTRGYATAGTEYGQVLPRYTRKAELYEGFDTVAKGIATWRAPELQRAAVATSVKRYQLDAAAAAHLWQTQELQEHTAREFHLALYIPEKQLNDLEAAGTLWRAYLELPDGSHLEPLDVTVVRKTDKSSVEYPYVTPWTREYLLRFPLRAGSEPHDGLTLVLAGPLGTLRFAY